jgi:hypothetical protein
MNVQQKLTLTPADFFHEVKLIGVRIKKNRPMFALTGAQVVDKETGIEFFIQQAYVMENKKQLRIWIPGKVYVDGIEVAVTGTMKSKIANAILYTFKTQHQLFGCITIYE